MIGQLDRSEIVDVDDAAAARLRAEVGRLVDEPDAVRTWLNTGPRW